MRTLEQTFILPATASTLSFDFAFSTDATSSGVLFPDSFAASVLTAGGEFLDILVVDLLGVVPDPSDGIEGIIGAMPIDVAIDDTVTIPGFIPFAAGTSYSGRIDVLLPSAVLGQNATVFFDLFDEFDGASTIAAVDNVGTRAIPAPGAFGLVLAGLIATISVRRRRMVLCG
jgi:hypothetical protein